MKTLFHQLCIKMGKNELAPGMITLLQHFTENRNWPSLPFQKQKGEWYEVHATNMRMWVAGSCFVVYPFGLLYHIGESYHGPSAPMVNVSVESVSNPHWKRNVVILMNFASLAVPEVFIFAGSQKLSLAVLEVAKMANFCNFQCSQWCEFHQNYNISFSVLNH